jgi:hypothetical protein
MFMPKCLTHDVEVEELCPFVADPGRRSDSSMRLKVKSSHAMLSGTVFTTL